MEQVQYDVIIVDQVSAVIPLLKLLTSSRILFYCHFPDMLLAERRSAIKRLYRAPLDWVEQHTTGQADLVLVNSRFTAGIFASTFQRLAKRKLEPQVLYPAVAVPAASTLLAAQAGWREALGPVPPPPDLLASSTCSSREAGVSHQEPQVWPQAQGVAAPLCQHPLGAGLPENVEHFEELQQLVRELGLQEEVRFLPSFTDKQRSALLAACTAVIYTPQHEHFGIVPLEAMVAGRPVLAANSGGPTESVVHGVTGFLCDPTPSAFASAARQLLAQGGAKAHSMGEAARAHIVDRFSRAAFGKQLDSYIKGLVNQGEAPRAG
ncbi:alpha-1,3 1,6-mannosyltransferase ALG2 [Haematococcus lacustris]|uniref:Alpha-1,3/1,6-mannosyltransferase ALG2 n=1 Tax=Haematococcus lacustris TaxID=44745 RepID=A0A699YMT1_HAELA|nr:alpha-1,3 1,6-mannosyltransferase ALG2 [Haematococcus lacustris]